MVVNPLHTHPYHGNNWDLLLLWITIVDKYQAFSLIKSLHYISHKILKSYTWMIPKLILAEHMLTMLKQRWQWAKPSLYTCSTQHRSHQYPTHIHEGIVIVTVIVTVVVNATVLSRITIKCGYSLAQCCALLENENIGSRWRAETKFPQWIEAN